MQKTNNLPTQAIPIWSGETGNEVDANNVAKNMRRENDVDGKRMFSIDEFLTVRQISTFFSREVARRRQKQIPQDYVDISNMLNAEEETHIGQLHDLVADMLCFKHLIVVDDNIDLCKLPKAGQKKKKKKKKTQSQKTTRSV